MSLNLKSPFDFIVCDRSQAGKTLMSTTRRIEITHVISIFDASSGDRNRSRPCTGFFSHPAKKIALQFDDVTFDEPGYVAPNEEDISKLIDFSKSISSDLETGAAKALIHCFAGKSRSTAAAFIMTCVLLGPNREVEALDEVFARRDCAEPNTLMVTLADKLLDRKSSMIQALYMISSQKK